MQKVILFQGRVISQKSNLSKAMLPSLSRWVGEKLFGQRYKELFHVTIEVATPISIPTETKLYGPDGNEWKVVKNSRNFKQLASVGPIGINYRKEGEFRIAVPE